MSGISSLTIDVRPGEHLMLEGGRIIVELLDKSGKLARLRVTAPRDVSIKREDGPHAQHNEPALEISHVAAR
jgi:sRNA-binding carbon storage regulator CsrA